MNLFSLLFQKGKPFRNTLDMIDVGFVVPVAIQEVDFSIRNLAVHAHSFYEGLNISQAQTPATQKNECMFAFKYIIAKENK